MQISRHWRLNVQRYRLQGVRYRNGSVSIQDRPNPLSEEASTLAKPILDGVAQGGGPQKIEGSHGRVEAA